MGFSVKSRLVLAAVGFISLVQIQSSEAFVFYEHVNFLGNLIFDIQNAKLIRSTRREVIEAVRSGLRKRKAI